jgi:hypothetical protein
MAIGTDGSSGLGLNQGLQTLTHQFGDELTGRGAIEQLRQFRGGRMGDGHGLVSGRW